MMADDVSTMLGFRLHILKLMKSLWAFWKEDEVTFSKSRVGNIQFIAAVSN